MTVASRNQDVVSRRLNGQSLSAIASVHQISTTNVSTILWRAGVGRIIGESASDATCNQVLEMWAEGRSTADIQAVANLSPKRIHSIVHRARANGDDRAARRQAKPKSRSMPANYRSSEQVADLRNEVLDLWIDGYTGSEIAEQAVVARSQVYGMIADARVAGDCRATRRRAA